MARLEGKVCVVTGASSGIGAATVRALAAEGATVVAAARRMDRLDDLARDVAAEGGTCRTVRCDVTDRDDVRALIDTAAGEHGRLDILVNNAGIMPLAPMTKCRMDEWDAMIDVNVKGLLYGIGFALPVMLAQGSGHVVNISSVAGRKVLQWGIVYGATKHAVHVISDGLREELAQQAKDDGNRIRVTVIAPGLVETELLDSTLDEETGTAFRKYAGSLPGPLQSEDIAAAITYAVTVPDHVDVNEILLRPVAQIR